MLVVTSIKHFRGGGQVSTPRYVDALVSADVLPGPQVQVGPISAKLAGGEVLTLSALETWWAHVALIEAFLDQVDQISKAAPSASY